MALSKAKPFIHLGAVCINSKDSESLFEELNSKPKVPIYLKEVEKELIGRIRTQFDYKSGENPYVKFTKIEIPCDDTVVYSWDAESIREFHRVLLDLRKKAIQMKLDGLIFVLDENDVHCDKKVVLMNGRLFSCPSVVLLNYNEETYKNALPSKGTTQSICSRLIEKSMMVEGSKYVLAIFSSEILHYLHYIKIFEVLYNSVRMIIVKNDCTVSSIWKTPMVACKGSKFSSIKATRMDGFLPAAKTTVVKKYCIYFERALVQVDYVVGTKPDRLGREESDAETFSRGETKPRDFQYQKESYIITYKFGGKTLEFIKNPPVKPNGLGTFTVGGNNFTNNSTNFHKQKGISSWHHYPKLPGCVGGFTTDSHFKEILAIGNKHRCILQNVQNADVLETYSSEDDEILNKNSGEDPDRLGRGAAITAAVKPVEVEKEEIVRADVVEPDGLSDKATATGADVEVQKEEIVRADVVEDPDRLGRGAAITAAVKPVKVQKEEIVRADVVEPDGLSDEATATGADVEVQKEEIVRADVVDLENVNTVSPPPPSIAVLAEAIAALEIDELSKFEQDQFERYNRGIDLMNMAFGAKRAIAKAREYAQ